MNSREFRAVLDWWIASDPFPQLPQITVDEWLHNESVQRGYLGIIDAYHNHEADVSTAPSSPGLPPEQASSPVPEAGFDPERHRDAGPSATSAGGDEPSARPLSDAALGRLGQAMLADYVSETERMRCALATAERLLVRGLPLLALAEIRAAKGSRP